MPTLSDALQRFLQLDRRDATNKQYRMVLSRLVSSIGPGRQIERVTYEDLLDYQADLRTHVNALTVAGYTSIVKTFFNWCVKRGYIAASPAADLVRRKPARNPTENRAIPPDELRRMVEYARVTSPRNHAILLFLADTGCRVGGLVSLTRSNLHLDVGMAYLQEKGGVWFQARFVDETAQALQRWLDVRPDTGHDFVFTSRGADHPPLSRISVYDLIRTLSRKTGASREWHPHAIRHAVGHAYAKAGVPATITAQKLGHKHPGITMQYYYPQDDAYLDLVSRRLGLSALKSEDELLPKPAPITKIKRSV